MVRKKRAPKQAQKAEAFAPLKVPAHPDPPDCDPPLGYSWSHLEELLAAAGILGPVTTPKLPPLDAAEAEAQLSQQPPNGVTELLATVDATVEPLADRWARALVATLLAQGGSRRRQLAVLLSAFTRAVLKFAVLGGGRVEELAKSGLRLKEKGKEGGIERAARGREQRDARWQTWRTAVDDRAQCRPWDSSATVAKWVAREEGTTYKNVLRRCRAQLDRIRVRRGEKVRSPK